MRLTGAKRFFDRLPRSVVPRYAAYWRRLTPATDDDVLRRWLFAFCSVHTSWQGNVRGYTAIKRLDWKTKEELVLRLQESKTGMHNMKANFIWGFVEKFRRRPGDYRDPGKRDELMESVTGLGAAKTSFALNMIAPLESRVICLDVHMLRLYGMEDLDYKTDKGLRLYKRAERDWVERCETVPPYLAHSIYWDRLHGQTNSNYWGYVLQ